MCADQVYKTNASCSYSLFVPDHQVCDVQTIIVTCSEIEGKIPAADLDRLQPYAYLTLPGGQLVGGVDPECSADTLSFLEALLMSARHAAHIIVCFHTGCRYLDIGTKYDCSVIPITEETDNLLIPAQHMLMQEISILESICRRNQHLAARKLTLHGWLYEPEISWVSFLDSETGQFLPLNAQKELCS